MDTPGRPLRFLTICEGGNVRSVALAYVLKYACNMDAIAVSHAKTGDEAIGILSEWADYIVALQPHFVSRIPGKHAGKVRIVDVGPDRWGNPLNEELVEQLSGVVRQWMQNGFKL